VQKWEISGDQNEITADEKALKRITERVELILEISVQPGIITRRSSDDSP
jgi:hypothetical protein